MDTASAANDATGTDAALDALMNIHPVTTGSDLAFFFLLQTKIRWLAMLYVKGARLEATEQLQAKYCEDSMLQYNAAKNVYELQYEEERAFVVERSRVNDTENLQDKHEVYRSYMRGFVRMRDRVFRLDKLCRDLWTRAYDESLDRMKDGFAEYTSLQDLCDDLRELADRIDF